MTIKQFLKPDQRKIVLMIVVTIIFYYLFLSLREIDKKACESTELFPFMIFPKAFCDIRLIPFFLITNPIVSIIEIQGSIVPYEANILFMFIQLPYYYLLSCLIVWIYDKTKKKKH